MIKYNINKAVQLFFQVFTIGMCADKAKQSVQRPPVVKGLMAPAPFVVLLLLLLFFKLRLHYATLVQIQTRGGVGAATDLYVYTKRPYANDLTL